MFVRFWGDVDNVSVFDDFNLNSLVFWHCKRLHQYSDINFQNNMHGSGRSRNFKTGGGGGFLKKKNFLKLKFTKTIPKNFSNGGTCPMGRFCIRLCINMVSLHYCRSMCFSKNYWFWELTLCYAWAKTSSFTICLINCRLIGMFWCDSSYKSRE